MKLNENDYEKRKLLIESAKKEFISKGYNKASLRSICANAGVTTGALYFFFENKEDLYNAIVNGPVEELKKMIIDHFDRDCAYNKKIDIDLSDLDHTDLSDEICEHVYKNYDCFMLLLSGSRDGAREQLIDEFVHLIENSYTGMLDRSTNYGYDTFMLHWMSHTMIDSLIHIVKHEQDVILAKKRLAAIMNLLVAGSVQFVITPK